MNLPTSPIGVEEQVDQSCVCQQRTQSLHSRQRLAQVMQNAHGIDVVKGSLTLEIEKTALLLTQRIHLIRGTGSLQAFTGYFKSSRTDIHRQDLRSWIEVTEVIRADARPTTRIKNSQRSRWISLRWHCTMHCCQNAFMAPAPVVARRRSVLKRIPRIWEPVIKVTHHRGGGIRGLGVHRRVGFRSHYSV